MRGKMQVIKNDKIVFSDVDETLILYDGIKYWEPNEGAIEIIHPLDNSVYYVIPHKEHIALLKKYKAQGYTVIVWSAQGYEWATTVVDTLGLRDNPVDICMSKALKFMDDLQASEGILGTRVYILPGVQHKKIEPGEQE